MKKLASFIVKGRIYFAVIFTLLAIAGAVLCNFVKQNYDMTKYLPATSDTSRGLAVMKEEFGLNNNILLMLPVGEDGEAEAQAMCDKIGAVEGVQLVSVDSIKDGKALLIIMMSGDEYSASTKAAVSDIRELLGDENYALSGSAVASGDLEHALKTEIPIIMVIAIAIIFLVLLFTSHAWLEPIVFALVLLVAVLINMGSNIIFGEISYITFAVSAILQIALAMDYSIILLHGFTQRKESGMSKEEALIDALAYNMRPISSSGLTTIAGLIALLFMSFTIGFDIGIVLAKGILISLLSVIFFMPALILLFNKPLEKTAHKAVPLGGGGIAKVSISLRAILPVLLIIVILGSYVLQASNVYTFSGWDVNKGGEEIADNFGYVNQAVVIIDNQYAEDKEAQTKFIDSLSSLTNERGLPAYKSINSWTTFEIAPEALAKNFEIDADFQPLLRAVFSLENNAQVKVADLKRLWENCGGDIYNFAITKQMFDEILNLASTLTSSDVSTFSAFYGLLPKDKAGNVSLSSLTGISDFVLLGMPNEVKTAVRVLRSDRVAIAEAFDRIVTSVLDEHKDDLNVPLLSSDIDMGSIIGEVCNALFGTENFQVFDFYTMWNECEGNIMDMEVTPQIVKNILGVPLPDFMIKMLVLSLVDQDGKVTVQDLLEYVIREKEALTEIVSDFGDAAVFNFEKVVGACMLAYSFREVYTPLIKTVLDEALASVKSNFVGENHSRIILMMDLPKDSSETNTAIVLVKKNATKYFGEDNFVAGESMTIKDISDAFSSDLKKINFVTLVSIFLIIAILFRSLLLPILLVLVIQGAIWITMAIYSLLGIPIFFMSYIICVCIQMGATIDYGILIASNYRRNRATMPKFAAVATAVKSAMPTIFTSGLILIAAGFTIGFVSSVMPIYSIGRLLGLGTIISIILILFMLPALLYLFDKLISLLTFDGVKVLKTVKRKKRGKQLALQSGSAVSCEIIGSGEETKVGTSIVFDSEYLLPDASPESENKNDIAPEKENEKENEPSEPEKENENSPVPEPTEKENKPSEPEKENK